jgi:hypothetical protein
VSSPFGIRQLNGRSDLHTGVDVAASEGTPVAAMLPGVVVLAAPSGQVAGYGNVVVLQHGPALFSLYAHLSRMLVQRGAVVPGGAVLGQVGRTAGTPSDPAKLFDVSGAHLHFEFLSQWPPRGKDLDRLDPGPVLRALGIIVPQSGPLVLASCNATDPSTPAASPATSGVWAELEPQPPMRRAASAGVGGLAAFAVLAMVASALKDKRRAGL